MQSSTKKIKLLIFSAIALAVALFACSVFLLVTVTKKQIQIQQQQEEIEKLNNKLNYYSDNNFSSPDKSITIENEEE